MLAQRLGLRRGFDSVTNVMAVLWSAEVLHDLRIRTASFRAVCPDSIDSLTAWLEGDPPSQGTHTVLAILDPTARGRSRTVVGFEAATAARVRFRGYADAVKTLRSTES